VTTPTQNAKLPGYWVLNVHTSYDITRNVQIFALANNLLDKRYALFGTSSIRKASRMQDCRSRSPTIARRFSARPSPPTAAFG